MATPFDTAPLQAMFNTARENMDYGQNFSDMLAPYQAAAKQFQSPYALFRPDSWIAQNHPMAAKMLDTIGLTAAMTPGPQGPEGAGQGISRAFQGLVGANQFRRQQMLQSAMLPYQMMMPMLQARDVMSQTMQRSAEAPYYLARGERYMNQIEAGERNRFVPGGLRTSDQGDKWQEIFDPVGGKTRLFNPTSQRYADELPSDQQPKFAKEERANRMNTPGGLEGEILSMLMSADPAIRAQGQQMRNLHVGIQKDIAGGRTAGSQEAPHPFSESKDFYDREVKTAGDRIKTQYPALTPSQFEDLQTMNKEYWKPGAPERLFKEYNDKRTAASKQFDQMSAAYRRSGAWSRGVGFEDFAANPSQYGAAPDNAGVSGAGNAGAKPQITVDNPFPVK